MTELFNKNLLRKILASISIQFDKNLLVREREPNTLQLLKLAIRAFFNNILKCAFLDIHGNNLLKALWLLQNMECARKIYGQYNFLDYFPYIENGNYIPSFSINHHHNNGNGDVIHEWNNMLYAMPNILAAIGSLRKVREKMKHELILHLKYLNEHETKLSQTFINLAINMLYDIGEYNSTIDRFIDIFLPVARDDNEDILLKKAHARNIDNTHENEPIFSDKSICLLTRSRDGGKILTILSDSNKDAIGRLGA